MATDALQKTQLAAMVTAYLATVLTPKVGLFKDVITVTPETNLALLAKPTGSWYAPITFIFGAVREQPDGSMLAVGASKQFQYSGSDAGETVTGWLVVVTGTPDVYISAGNLPAPVQMANTLDGVVVQPSLRVAAIPQIA